MSDTECLHFQHLLSYLNDTISSDEKDDIRGHLQICRRCSDELEFVRSLVRSVSEEKAGKPRHTEEIHISDEMREAYFQGTLTAPEIGFVDKHLAQCSECATDFSTISRNVDLEITPQEMAVCRRIDAAEVEDRLERYKAHFRLPKKRLKAQRRVPGLLKNKWPRLAVIANWKYASAIALSFLVYFAYQYRTKLATFGAAEREFAVLSRVVEIPDFALRPTGGFRFTFLTERRAAGDETPAIEVADYQSIQQALELDPSNVVFNHYLGTIHFFNDNFAKAEEFYLKALVLDANNAKLYNDLALIDVERKDFQKATEHLGRALELDPALIEARYNIAVVAELMGDTERSIELWREYLDVDTDPNSIWKLVAQDHLKDLSE